MALLGIALSAAPVVAQDTATNQTEAETAAPETDAPADPNAPGTSYRLNTHSDWEIRCIRANEGQVDPCQLYQLLTDDQGGPVAEFTVYLIPGQEEVAAGATIAVPLQTLLSQPLAIKVDRSPAKTYPYRFCTQVSCFARIGLTQQDVDSYRRGNGAIVSIVPLALPDQRVNLGLSLSGFTAAFKEMVESQEQPAE
ncbi:hypothetical protein ACMU_08105 [Actibacterium mucosum KCTC 23349]|uniref:Invasion protein n=2 Tax=Actibacterium TaxID=1433986 RepID=A0A037ZMP0_9RHOB|nr:hypothetical protein ACMU_08105 [Actibacterium mucosum KCTC 23349]